MKSAAQDHIPAYGASCPCDSCQRSATTLVLGGEGSEAADRVLDAIAVALQEFDTETLRAAADYRESVWKDCWMPPLLRQYVEVHQ